MKNILVCFCIDEGNPLEPDEDGKHEIVHVFAMDHGKDTDARAVATALGYNTTYVEVRYARLYEQGDIDLPSIQEQKSQLVALRLEVEKLEKKLAEGVRKPR